MKNQYVGDIGDFGKLLVLKHLANLGLKIGVNWLLTENDGTDDGKHRDYISYRGHHCLCTCDQDIFQKISRLAKQLKVSRSIHDLEHLILGFSESTVFYRGIYGPNSRRDTLEAEALSALNAERADVIFFDPDNGIGFGDRRSRKHVYFDDMRRYWNRGQSLLTYHHLSRNGSHEEQVLDLKQKFRETFKEGAVYPYRLRRGTARVYLLCLQPKHQSITKGIEQIETLAAFLKTKGEWAKIQQRIGQRCEAIHFEDNCVPLASHPARSK